MKKESIEDGPGGRAEGCPDPAAAWRILQGGGSRRERRRLEEHISACPDCRAWFSEIAKMGQAGEAGTEPPPRTTPPSIEPYVREAPGKGSTRVGAPARRRRGWAWAVGLGAPAAAAAGIYILAMLHTPAVTMGVWTESGRPVRSAGRVPVRDGDAVRAGDRLRVEVQVHEEGYLYLFLLTENEAGEFLFPSETMDESNRVRPGERLILPAGGEWIVGGTRGAADSLYLLFSERPVGPAGLHRISHEAGSRAADRHAVERLLSGHFRIEQQIRYVTR